MAHEYIPDAKHLVSNGLQLPLENFLYHYDKLLPDIACHSVGDVLDAHANLRKALERVRELAAEVLCLEIEETRLDYMSDAQSMINGGCTQRSIAAE